MGKRTPDLDKNVNNQPHTPTSPKEVGLKSTGILAKRRAKPTKNQKAVN